MDEYETFLKKAKKLHGGVCAGVVMGIMMSLAAMRELGMDPAEQNKDLIVHVEIDRCMTDGVQAVTGCTLGHRNLKYNDYGKFVATFVNMTTRKAIRVSARDDTCESCFGFWSWAENLFKGNGEYKPLPTPEDMEEGVEIVSWMPEEELLVLEEVPFKIPENDIPGFPKHITECEICGEHVMDSKELLLDNKIICGSCASKINKKEWLNELSIFETG